MSDYKLVPVEMALPCPFCGSSNIGNKYIETYSTDSSYDTFGCKDCGARFEDGCQDDWNRRAAPAVQGEPAVIPQISGVGRDKSHPRAVILYLRSEPTDDDIRTIQDALRTGCVQPAEQQPAPDVDSYQICETHQPISTPCCHVCLMQDRDRHRDGRLAALERAAKAESDVSALVEALEEIVKQYPNPNISHENFRVHACRHAESALSAYRKGGE